MAAPNGERRWAELDVLRAVAVLLVIGRHFVYGGWPKGFMYWFLKCAAWVGWAGVDLFLALSGFLIASLLFQEHSAYGKISWTRFLTRRAFKIYPGFYLLIALSLVGFVEPQAIRNVPNVAGELFFLQNYVGRLWQHTWSLALEEHFYFLMALLFVVPWHAAIVRRWAWVAGSFAAGCLAARLVTSAYIPFYWDTHIQQTQLRIDGLFFGSYAGYLFHFHKAAVVEFIARRRALYNLATLVALVIPFLRQLEESFFVQTFGLTFLSLGCSMLTLGSAAGAFKFRQGRIRAGMERIGRCSYAIYLWHCPIVWGFVPEVENYIPFRLPEPVRFAFYVIASLCMGIVMTKWVEAPMLRLRDRLFPRRTAAPREQAELIPA